MKISVENVGVIIVYIILENYGHRLEVRKALASNQDWISQYFGKILPMMSGQTNVGLISMYRGGKPDLVHPEGQGKQISKYINKQTSNLTNMCNKD